MLPLIEDLAGRLQTGATGADLANLVPGLRGYLSDKGLADDYSVIVRRSPSLDWVAGELQQNHQALLLLGFWELQPAGWQRLGGHYVAVSGMSCAPGADWIAFSDPFRDSAEFGWRGRSLPPGAHGHPATPPDAVHNDAAYVSHDLYGITQTANGWGPQGYAQSYVEITNFAGQNFAPALEAFRAAGPGGGEIVTLADFALVVAPRGGRCGRVPPGGAGLQQRARR